MSLSHGYQNCQDMQPVRASRWIWGVEPGPHLHFCNTLYDHAQTVPPRTKFEVLL